MQRLSQAPALCYKIQIQLNEIFFISIEISIPIVSLSLSDNAKVGIYFILSKFFSLKICFPSAENKKLMRSA